MFPQPIILNSLVELPFNVPLQHQQQEQQQLMLDRQQFELCRHRSGDVQNTNYGLSMDYYTGRQTLPQEVKVELYNRSLWKIFNAETTEMIITKNGRRMFPSVEITVSGLEKQNNYCILIELIPASDRRQKYVKSGEGTVDEVDLKSDSVSKGWMPTSFAEPQPELNRRVLLHPDSPAKGSHWMKQKPISFSKVKITNDTSSNQHNQILLTSMHKYRARIWIVMCDNIFNLKEFHSYPSSIYTLKETEFIAVTAYQNENIIHLKIANNPFAKGFRKDGQSRCKRKCQKEKNILEDYTVEEKDNIIEETKDDQSSEEQVDVTSLESTEQSKTSMSDTSSSDSYEFNNNNNEILPSSLLNTYTHKKNDQKTQPLFHRPWTNKNDSKQNNAFLQWLGKPIYFPPVTHNQYNIHSYSYFSPNHFYPFSNY